MMPAPAPLRTGVSQPFWDSLRNHRVSMQRCRGCKEHIFYPRYFCPKCGCRDLEWVDVSGYGHVYTFTVAEVPVSPDFLGLQPQILVIVELRERARVPSSLVDIAPEAVAIGMKVTAAFDDQSFPGLTVLRFRPARSARAS